MLCCGNLAGEVVVNLVDSAKFGPCFAHVWPDLGRGGGDFGRTRRHPASMLANFVADSAKSGVVSARFGLWLDVGEVWPECGQRRPRIGLHWATSADFDPSSAQLGPNWGSLGLDPVNFGRRRPKLTRIGPNLARICPRAGELGRMLLDVCQSVARTRPNLGDVCRYWADWVKGGPGPDSRRASC